MTDAQELAELCLALAEGMYEKNGREYVHPAVLHVVAGEKHEIVFLPGFGPPPSKQALRALCVLSALAGADMLAFVYEGWALRAKSFGEAQAERHKVMGDLSLHPERREVLMIDVKGPSDGWSITAELDRSGPHAKALPWRSESQNEKWYSRFLSDLPWKETIRT